MLITILSRLKKVLELPWVFWAVLAFSLFETSTAIVFSQNATELAEIRLGVSSVDAGWYTSVVQYGGFFIVPLLGIFIDLYGNRISIRMPPPSPNNLTSSLTLANSCILRNWSLHRNVSRKLDHLSRRHIRLPRNLRFRFLFRSNQHYRQYPYFDVASECLRFRIRS